MHDFQEYHHVRMQEASQQSKHHSETYGRPVVKNICSFAGADPGFYKRAMSVDTSPCEGSGTCHNKKF